MGVIGVVLDTAALVEYAYGRSRVGSYLAVAADKGDLALVPATCLASAYRDVNAAGTDLLDVLSNLDHVVVAPLEAEHCAVLGGWARTLGLDTAHAAIEAAFARSPLITRKRDLVTKFLAPEWPIVDI
jgi:hypothetical protein